MRLETNGKISKVLKQRKEQFYNHLATVLQEKALMRHETNRRMNYIFVVEERQFKNSGNSFTRNGSVKTQNK